MSKIRKAEEDYAEAWVAAHRLEIELADMQYCYDHTLESISNVPKFIRNMREIKKQYSILWWKWEYTNTILRIVRDAEKYHKEYLTARSSKSGNFKYRK